MCYVIDAIPLITHGTNFGLLVYAKEDDITNNPPMLARVTVCKLIKMSIS